MPQRTVNSEDAFIDSEMEKVAKVVAKVDAVNAQLDQQQQQGNSVSYIAFCFNSYILLFSCAKW